MTTNAPAVASGLIPPAPSPWKICDIDALLRAGDFDTLDRQLDASLAASFHDRKEEGLYHEALPADMSACAEAGAEGLARLLAWQAARPQSAHAWLCEAHYWYHWAYEYRGSGWANTVTPLGWACAHACATRCIVAALRALDLAPTMWNVPALLLQCVSAFSEPDWLTELVRSGRWPVTQLQHEFPLDEMDAEDRAELQAMLARSGLQADERMTCPENVPAALPPPLQGRKMLEGHRYWMHAAMHIHPRLFFFMQSCVWFMQPRWGGSHEQILAFIASPACAHLDAVEKDRLRQEVWRDEYLHDIADDEDDAEDVAQWMAETRERANTALHPYHRWETLRWMALSHYGRSEFSEGLACMREGEGHHPIDDDHAMAIALYMALKVAPQDHWVGQAICNSANAHQTTAAQILHGYCSLKGALGFVPNEALGNAWLEAAKQRDPRSGAWNKLSRVFWLTGHPAHAYELLMLGMAAEGDSCAYTLAEYYEKGVHVAPDLQKAAHYYRLTMEEGGNMGAYDLAYTCHTMAWATEDLAQRSKLMAEAIEAMRRAHEMGHTEGLDHLLMFISDQRDIAARQPYVALVREHAQQGNPNAMATLSALLADSDDKALYDYRESVRWIMGAQAIAPDSEFVKNMTRTYHEDGFLGKLQYKLHRKQIKAHEIPGGDNAMV